jgi:tetratricopeptide (TPR) repeat protein
VAWHAALPAAAKAPPRDGGADGKGKGKDEEKGAEESPLDEILADAYFAMGRGYYNVGEIDHATTYLTKATQVKKTPDALEQLGTIAHKRGRWQEAATRFNEAAAIERDAPLEDRMEKARLRRLVGEAYLRGKDRARAETEFMKALDSWTEIVGADLERSQLALAYTEMARLRYALGHSEDAITDFERAVDADPEQPSVYADVIAFLFTRGHYLSAVDAWHRGVHRTEVTEYFKVYTTLWIQALARLRGENPEAFAHDYLASRNGRRWFHELARYGSGRISYEELLAKADTRGKRAEAFFYEALTRYGKGDRAGAEKLLRRVVATDMLGFFEYDMATYFLDHGPPR